MSLTEILDGASFRNQATAIPALPGATSIQKVAGVLSSVDDQAVATALGAGAGTVHTSGSITGDGSVGTPIVSAKLDAVLNVKRGADIPDADTTINPGTDKCSEYRVLGPRTANRILTVANGATPLLVQTVNIIDEDTSAFTLTIKNGAGTTSFTSAASPGAGVIRWYQLYFNGTNFTANVSGYAQST